MMTVDEWRLTIQQAQPSPEVTRGLNGWLCISPAPLPIACWGATAAAARAQWQRMLQIVLE